MWEFKDKKFIVNESTVPSKKYSLFPCRGDTKVLVGLHFLTQHFFLLNIMLKFLLNGSYTGMQWRPTRKN